MHRRNPFHYRQPQPGAFATASPITSGKRVEDCLKLGRINPRATVHHAQHHIRRADIPRHISRNLDVFASMVQGIADQVVEQTLHRYPPQRKRLNRLQAQAYLLAVLVIGRHDFADQFTQINFFDRLVTTIANKREELVATNQWKRWI